MKLSVFGSDGVSTPHTSLLGTPSILQSDKFTGSFGTASSCGDWRFRGVEDALMIYNVDE
ncbi:hypothetical protein KEJ39_02470 [Candidatus Bathyarchaeota archaeon]|nr:hypothetical protein [Candidatus Bathyarchaeota archaeon]